MKNALVIDHEKWTCPTKLHLESESIGDEFASSTSLPVYAILMPRPWPTSWAACMAAFVRLAAWAPAEAAGNAGPWSKMRLEWKELGYDGELMEIFLTTWPRYYYPTISYIYIYTYIYILYTHIQGDKNHPLDICIPRMTILQLMHVCIYIYIGI